MPCKHTKNKLHLKCHQGNSRENNTTGTTTHLLEWPKPGTLTTPNAEEEVEKQELSSTVGRKVKHTARCKIVGWFLTKL